MNEPARGLCMQTVVFHFCC